MSRHQQDRAGGSHRGSQSRGPRAPEGSPALSADDARKIVEGDAALLVECAKGVARDLKDDEASRTQLRRLYGEVKRIEMLWRSAKQGDAKEHEVQWRVLLLKPRLAYQVARQSKLRGLQRTIEPVIDSVGGDRQRFQRFVEFFEAIVAYAR